MSIAGTSGNDTLTGTSGDDIFLVSQGGDDTVSGGSGNDVFFFGASFTAADTVDGGPASDRIALGGDYTGAHALVLGASTITSVETISLTGGFSYDITTNDANLTAGELLSIRGQTMTASDTLTFDGSAETNGKIAIYAGAGNDVLTGGAGADVFNLTSGGEDTAHGGAGNDTFVMGTSLDAGDTLDGGTGNDFVTLTGDYSGANAVVLGASTMTGIVTMRFSSGFSYDITTNDANLAAGKIMVVNAGSLGASDSLTFNGSAETNGVFHFADGAGDDVLTGGAGNDTFDMYGGGTDTVSAGAGNDYISFKGNLTASDHVDGGSGVDTLLLDGDYSTGLTLATGNFANLDIVTLTAGHSYNLTVSPITGGSLFTVHGGSLGASDALTFDGFAFNPNDYNPAGPQFGIAVTAGAGDDVLIGSSQSDALNAGNGTNFLTGGSGPDKLTGGTGVDTFIFHPGDSQSAFFDTITNFDASQDLLDTWVTVAGIASPVTTDQSSRSQGSFNNILTHDLGGLPSDEAVVYTVTGGGYAGHTFLVVNTSGATGYDASNNLVIDITGASNLGDLSASTFV